MLSSLESTELLLLLLGGLGIGVSKSGFPGVGMLHIVLYAMVFGAKDSTGVLLPMLVFGDVCAIRLFGRVANWAQIRRLLPPTLVGVVVGALLMDRLDESIFRPIVGVIILSLTVVQVVRMFRPKMFDHMRDIGHAFCPKLSKND
ncbi:MAG: sulfite exporter TauE/SafE family protein [Planctomycetota bacterium]